MSSKSELAKAVRSLKASGYLHDQTIVTVGDLVETVIQIGKDNNVNQYSDEFLGLERTSIELQSLPIKQDVDEKYFYECQDIAERTKTMFNDMKKFGQNSDSDREW
jgi:hypothetical protein